MDKEGFQKELKKIRNDEQLTETQVIPNWNLPPPPLPPTSA